MYLGKIRENEPVKIYHTHGFTVFLCWHSLELRAVQKVGRRGSYLAQTPTGCKFAFEGAQIRN